MQSNSAYLSFISLLNPADNFFFKELIKIDFMQFYGVI
jgi:hypothetical protein